MKKLLKITLLVSFVLISFVLFAQDSTGTVLPPAPNADPSDLLTKILNNLQIVIPAILAIYEIISRLVPTIKDYSFVNKIIGVLQWIMDKVIPNQSKLGGTMPNKTITKQITKNDSTT